MHAERCKLRPRISVSPHPCDFSTLRLAFLHPHIPVRGTLRLHPSLSAAPHPCTRKSRILASPQCSHIPAALLGHLCTPIPATPPRVIHPLHASAAPHLAASHPSPPPFRRPHIYVPRSPTPRSAAPLPALPRRAARGRCEETLRGARSHRGAWGGRVGAVTQRGVPRRDGAGRRRGAVPQPCTGPCTASVRPSPTHCRSPPGRRSSCWSAATSTGGSSRGPAPGRRATRRPPTSSGCRWAGGGGPGGPCEEAVWGAAWGAARPGAGSCARVSHGGCRRRGGCGSGALRVRVPVVLLRRSRGDAAQCGCAAVRARGHSRTGHGDTAVDTAVRGTRTRDGGPAAARPAARGTARVCVSP